MTPPTTIAVLAAVALASAEARAGPAATGEAPAPEAPAPGEAPAAGEAHVPEGSVPEAPAPALPAIERSPRWSWLRHPLSPTPMKTGQTRGPSKSRILPLPSVRSQPGVGLMLGANISYAYRRRDDLPNRVYVLFESRASLRRVVDNAFYARLRDLLRRDEIFEVSVTGHFDPVFPYFGVANHQNLDGSDLLHRYYQARVGVVGGALTYQHPLLRARASPTRPTGVLRSYVGFAYYVDRIVAYDDSLLKQHRPAESLHARRGLIRLGLTWDSRDNEWSPGKGSLFDVIVDNAGPWTGSSDGWGRFSANFRTYWTLGLDKLVLAHRLTFDGLWGDPPLIPLGEFGGLAPIDALGGAQAGRGWIRRRYIGRIKAFGSLELRFEPVEFRIRQHTLGVGLKGFVDLGVVSQRMMDLAKHWQVSGGTGLSLIWDRFAVLRFDAGFSRESFGLYFMTEHAF